MAEFRERGRIASSDKTEIVVSDVLGEDGQIVGVSISKYLKSQRFTGFVKGVQVPLDKLDELVALLIGEV